MKNAETTLDNLTILCLNGKLDGLDHGISYILFLIYLLFAKSNKCIFP